MFGQGYSTQGYGLQAMRQQKRMKVFTTELLELSVNLGNGDRIFRDFG
jgi:hypothetical protein